MSQLDSSEIERYARHIILPEIGGIGQQKLKSAKVVILGAGGLGSPVAAYLAAAGIGQIGIIDDDVVSLSNLQRQIIHDTAKIGIPKTESAKTSLERINPEIEITAHNIRLSDENADDLLSSYDIIVDGSDSFSTRYILADHAEQLKIPMVMAAVGRFDGSLTVFKPYINTNPRIRDLYPEEPPEGLLPSCAEAGIIGALTGVIGTLQAMEVIKLVTGIGEPLVGRLLLYDALRTRFDEIEYRRME
ncbi:molybdopterin-synthase adenylyltransferase MoeB [Lentilitoribacter sp. Alg239-R112]|uniref:molybdopterin-synthase adenylyltransferase MoeB n=1 Tax=Lentilitoribacter sp. Alg239-R112 TaxID=2305987 RepID=UPI0013A6F4F1|nr:molybdopterin-synthase adenylyltransferase MoeB [Lentilitoribacter sp. Alg239-R112]